ncbi:MAG: hypothetical protein M3M95_08520, partial [Pseudomonadota bacterium]|nr:hypothetical protein [Pseudomonadota bacterium]
MLVYGDQNRRVRPADLLAEARADLARGERLSALIGLGQLAQGLADLEFAERGADARSPAQTAVMGALTALARSLYPAHSRDSGNPGRSSSSSEEAWVAALAGLSDEPGVWRPTEIEVRIPEGFAFYALHPDLYAAAARRLPPGDWRVIGLRSIGTSLAAVAAAALGAP